LIHFEYSHSTSWLPVTRHCCSCWLLCN